MTTTKTPAQRGRANQSKGKTAERHLATYLRHWWPDARRAVVTGTSVRGGDGQVREQPDPGDIAGVPDTLWSVKDVDTRGRDAHLITSWLTDLDVMATLAGDTTALRFLIHKRRLTPVYHWWAWQRADQYARLLGGHSALVHPVRVELGDLIADLLHAGYGTDATRGPGTPGFRAEAG